MRYLAGGVRRLIGIGLAGTAMVAAAPETRWKSARHLRVTLRRSGYDPIPMTEAKVDPQAAQEVPTWPTNSTTTRRS